MSDADGSWPVDPHDPRCPHCDGPVSATTTYCMHCEEDLPTTDASGVGAGDPLTADESSNSTASTDVGEGGWFHPDGLLDDSLTAAVGGVTGLVAGILATTTVVFALPGGWPFLVGGVAWVVVTTAVLRNRSVFGGLRSGGYLVAMVLVALPVVLASTAPVAEPATGERLGLALVLAIFAWPVAALLAGVGYLFGGRASTGEDEG